MLDDKWQIINMEILTNPLFEIIFTLVILLYSAILHEISHGYVADRLGDPTARLMGRLTLNPKSHVDPFLSLALPLLLLLSGSPVIFGGAKPVPVDPFNFKEARKDMALVSLAGPLTNVAIAILASLLFRSTFLFPQEAFLEVVQYFLIIIIKLNMLLAIFNLLPIPPLDGSKVFALLLPEKEANAYLSMGNIGMIILFALLVFPIGGFSLGDLIFNLLQLSLKILLP